MTVPKSKSSLSQPQCRLIELLQQLNFGRIEGLKVLAGEPVFDPAPRLIHKVKIGGENGPRAEIAHADFLLKQQTMEMLEAISRLENGHVLAIEIKHGLPFSMEVEYRSRGGKGHPND